VSAICLSISVSHENILSHVHSFSTKNLDGNMVLVKNDINATWRAMEELVDHGLTRFIGLSNFNCQHLRQVLSVARIRPTSLQVECHPHLSQGILLRFAREAGIRVR
jgi:D-xylose reductase